MLIPFNKPSITNKEEKYILKAIKNTKISGDGKYTKKCEKWFEKNLGCDRALLTTSCTHSLEIAALLINVQEGDEIIMPSFTFVSTANAFVLRGAKIIFVDIKPDTMNIDETKIEKAITKKTKAIVPVHYAGTACEMDTIMKIAKKHNLFVIEDAAQAITSTYKGRKLGTIGHLGTFSFHETKNITSAGEGGLLIINEKSFSERATIIREKGTNRSLFFKGLVDKYSWVDIGSSYLLNDISAAYLLAQLENINKIQKNRIKTWNTYFKNLKPLNNLNLISLPTIPKECTNNAHIFYIKVKNLGERDKLLQYLKNNSIEAVFHYIPLHNSNAGKIFTSFDGEDKYTTEESNKLIRLPLYYGLTEKEIKKICKVIKSYFKKESKIHVKS